MVQQNEERPEQPGKTIPKKVEPVTVSELFTLGRKPAEDLVYLLFWTGMIGVLYNAFVFGKYISVTFSLMNTLSSDFYETTTTGGDHVLLGFVAGAIGFGVLFVLWKVCCELLLLIFKSLQKYVGSNLKMRGLSLLIILVFLTTACSNHTLPKVDSPAGEFLIEQGYEIIQQEDIVYEHRLEKKDLTQLPHQMYWSVQSVDAASYIGKIIYTTTFYVKNHPLDQAPSNLKGQTIVYVMQTENEVIGGYSLPDLDDPTDGWVYSLDGRTLEEFSGMDFGTWRQQWDSKYK